MDGVVSYIVAMRGVESGEAAQALSLFRSNPSKLSEMVGMPTVAQSPAAVCGRGRLS